MARPTACVDRRHDTVLRRRPPLIGRRAVICRRCGATALMPLPAGAVLAARFRCRWRQLSAWGQFLCLFWAAVAGLGLLAGLAQLILAMGGH